MIKPGIPADLRNRLITRLVKDEAAWTALAQRLQRAYTRSWTTGMTAAVQAALERLRGWPPGQFTAANAREILTQFEQAVGAEAMTRMLQGPVLKLSEPLYRLGITEVGQAAGVDLIFGLPDERALKVLSQGNLYWVGNSWNSYTQELLDTALRDYFREGMTRAQLTERFAEDFQGLSERGVVYWELMADHAATKTREMGRVSGYEQAAIEYVQVRAQLDDRTTPICRSLHGRIIATTRLRAQTDEYLDAISRRDMAGAKASWVMHQGADLDGIKTGDLPKGTAAPPYHFRCRTITVAYLGEIEAEFRHGPGLSAADRQAVESKTPAEHRAVVDSLQALARQDKLAYREGDWRQDMRKALATIVEILRHGGKEFGLQDPREYRRLGNQMVAEAERVFVQNYAQEGLQYLFLQSALGGWAVVDMHTRLRGVFGHQPAGLPKAVAGRLEALTSELI